MSRGCLWLFLNTLGGLFLLAFLVNIISNLFFPDNDPNRVANIVVGIVFFLCPAVLIFFFMNRATRRMRQILKERQTQIQERGREDVDDIARKLNLNRSLVQNYLLRADELSAKKQETVPKIVTRTFSLPKAANRASADQLQARLIRIADTIRDLSNLKEYSDVQPRYPGVKDNMLIKVDVKDSLGGIAENISAAAEALKTKTGMDGQPIEDVEIAVGLREMFGDTWAYHGFQDFFSDNLSGSDFASLSNAFAGLTEVIGVIEGIHKEQPVKDVSIKTSASEISEQKPYPPDHQTERRNLVLFLGGLFTLAVIGTVILAMHDRAAHLERDRAALHERAVIKSLQELNSVLQRFQEHLQGFPLELKYLGPSLQGEYGRGWIDAELASGKKDGYCFQYRTVNPSEGFGVVVTADGYTIQADPCEGDGSSLKHYFTDQSGVIRVARIGSATAESPEAKVNSDGKAISFPAYAALGLLGFVCFLLPVGLTLYYTLPYLKNNWPEVKEKWKRSREKQRAGDAIVERLRCARCKKRAPEIFYPGVFIAGYAGFGRCSTCAKTWCGKCDRKREDSVAIYHLCPQCGNELSNDLWN